MTDAATYRAGIAAHRDDPEALAALNTHMRWALAHENPSAWLRRVFAPVVTAPLAAHHEELWRWVWALRADEAPPHAFVACWSRAHGKSSHAELASAFVAGTAKRRYGLYVSDTQDRANDHLGSVGAALTAPAFAELYPKASTRRIGMYGHPKAWRRTRLSTASGFTMDAIGLDVAARGVKLEADRPDWIVADDLDDSADSPATTERKITALTRTILPAGAAHVAVLAVQNLVHPDSIFARLVDGRAEFLMGRHVSGPHPAMRGLAFRRVEDRFEITAGTPTWEGMGHGVCEEELNRAGPSAFLAEYQHEVAHALDSIFAHLTYERIAASELPDLVRVVVWVDPAVTDTDHSDAQAIIVDGLGPDGKLYRGLPIGDGFGFFEARTSPLDALRRAITWAYEAGAEHVGVETDQGGDTWESVYREALAGVLTSHPEWEDRRRPAFRAAKAGAGHGPKTHRASQMVPDYERGRIVHVLGAHEAIEAALNRFGRSKPYDLVDSCFWAWNDLRNSSVAARAHRPEGRIPAIR